MMGVRPVVLPGPFMNGCFDSKFTFKYVEPKVKTVKRPLCSDPTENSNPAKKKCVRFSEVSSCRVLPHEEQFQELSPESQDQKLIDLLSNRNQEKIQDEEFPTNEIPNKTMQDRKVRTQMTSKPSTLSNVEPSFGSNISVFDEDIQTDQPPRFVLLTKTTDGPSLVTLAADCLIQRLLKQGQISKREVLDILGAASDPRPPSPADSPAVSSEVGQKMSAADEQNMSGDGPRRRCLLDRTLCAQIHERLQSLTDRISSSGRAALLPSTTIMGRPLLPALAFLTAAAVDILRSIELSNLDEE